MPSVHIFFQKKVLRITKQCVSQGESVYKLIKLSDVYFMEPKMKYTRYLLKPSTNEQWVECLKKQIDFENILLLIYHNYGLLVKKEGILNE